MQRPPDADAGRHVHVVKLVEDDCLILEDVVVVIVVVVTVVLVLVVIIGNADGQLDDEVYEQHDGGHEAEGAVQRRVAVSARFRGHFAALGVNLSSRTVTSSTRKG